MSRRFGDVEVTSPHEEIDQEISEEALESITGAQAAQHDRLTTLWNLTRANLWPQKDDDPSITGSIIPPASPDETQNQR